VSAEGAAPRIGFAAMLEHLPPAEAVELAAHAERHGFSGTMASDRFQPWVPAQGQAPFVWNVLAAIGQRTSGDLGPGSVAPTVRMHPAVVAQASATLAAMHPGRHWLGLGAGEALDDHVTGEYWPEAPQRINRLFEAIEVIRKLFASGLSGRDVKHDGEFFRLETTRLWTMPEAAPPILVATTGPVAAKRAGRSADGLIAIGAPHEQLARLVQRFDEGAREAGRDLATTSKVLQLHLAWAPSRDEALANALRLWPNGAMSFPKGDIRSPFEFAQIAKLVRPEDLEERMTVSEDPDVHRAAIQRALDLGFDRVYLHNAGPDQRGFLEVFGREVLPGLRR